MSEHNYQVESVIRALDILEFLSERGGAGRVSDIAQAVGCSKNTAFRLLQTLMYRDFVRQAEDSSYELTFKLLNLGECVARNADLQKVARSHLEKLAKELGETVSVGVLDDHDIVYLDRVLGTMPYHTSYSVGSRAKAHSTALGKAILAHSSADIVEKNLRAQLKPNTEFTITDPEQLLAELQLITKNGYAIDNQENVLGIRCIAAPVFDRKGKVTAAISIAGLAVRLTDEWMKANFQKLLATTSEVSTRLGYFESRTSP